MSLLLLLRPKDVADHPPARIQGWRWRLDRRPTAGLLDEDDDEVMAVILAISNR